MRGSEGQAAMMMTLFFLAAMLVFTFIFARSAVSEASIARESILSRKSFAAAESGLEDAVYRFKGGNPVSSPITVDGIPVTILSGQDETGNFTQITASATLSAGGKTFVRKMRAIVGSGEFVPISYALQAGYLGARFEDNPDEQGKVRNGNVFSNGSIDGYTGQPALRTSVFVAKGAGDTIADGNQNPTSGIGSVELPIKDRASSSAKYRNFGAQRFQSPISGYPLKLEFYMKKVGNPGLSLSVDIYENTVSGGDDTPNVPAGSYIGGGTITSGMLSTSYQWVPVTFTADKFLKKGEYYWIHVGRGDQSNTNYYVFGGTQNGDYPDDYYPGNENKFLYSKNNNGPWRNPDGTGGTLTEPDFDQSGVYKGIDLLFRVYIGEVQTHIANMVLGSSCGDTSKTASAQLVQNSDVLTENLYCDSASGNDVGCNVPTFCPYPFTESPVQIPLDSPITTAKIDDWVSTIENSGTLINENVIVQSHEVRELGFTKINGNFTLKDHATTTLAGNVHVTGNAVFDNQCHLMAENGNRLLIVDGTVRIYSTCNVSGNETPGNPWRIFIISRNNSIPTLFQEQSSAADNSAIAIKSSAVASVLIAERGGVTAVDNAIVEALYGERTIMKDGAAVIYDNQLKTFNVTTNPDDKPVIQRWEETYETY